MAKATGQYVDPSVSRTKFEREIADFRAFESDYRARGWFLVKAEWPVVVVVLASAKTKPPAIVSAVQFDYTNYDAEPPSVRFIDPFSGQSLSLRSYQSACIAESPDKKCPPRFPAAPRCRS